METQEIIFKGFLINIFYLKDFIGAGKTTFQRLPGGTPLKSSVIIVPILLVASKNKVI